MAAVAAVMLTLSVLSTEQLPSFVGFSCLNFFCLLLFGYNTVTMIRKYSSHRRRACWEGVLYVRKQKARLFHFREKQLKRLNTRGWFSTQGLQTKKLDHNLGCIIMVNVGEPCRVVGCRLQRLRRGEKELHQNKSWCFLVLRFELHDLMHYTAMTKY